MENGKQHTPLSLKNGKQHTSLRMASMASMASKASKATNRCDFNQPHYPQQYIEYKQQNVTEEMIAQNYMGIIMQSNFNGPIKY